MRKLTVYRNKLLAGLLEEEEGNYSFEYNESYLADAAAPAISLTLPKSKEKYYSAHLFPFFFNMLSEGVNRKLQCRTFKIDEDDNFGLLAVTAGFDTIGAVTVKSVSL